MNANYQKEAERFGGQRRSPLNSDQQNVQDYIRELITRHGVANLSYRLGIRPSGQGLTQAVRAGILSGTWYLPLLKLGETPPDTLFDCPGRDPYASEKKDAA